MIGSVKTYVWHDRIGQNLCNECKWSHYSSKIISTGLGREQQKFTIKPNSEKSVWHGIETKGNKLFFEATTHKKVPDILFVKTTAKSSGVDYTQKKNFSLFLNKAKQMTYREWASV